MNTAHEIHRQLRHHPIILHMKGTQEEPRCGFSAKAAAARKSTGFDFAYVEVLSLPLIMQALPEVSDFPTFPQHFIHGEIIGGSDIIERVRTLHPDAIIDVTGEDYSFELYVISNAFAGQTILQRQNPILALFKDDISSGNIHALSIKAKTPEEQSTQSGLVPIKL